MTNWITKAANDIALEPGFIQARKHPLSNTQVTQTLLKHLPSPQPVQDIVSKIESALSDYGMSDRDNKAFTSGDSKINIVIPISGAIYADLKKYLREIK